MNGSCQKRDAILSADFFVEAKEKQILIKDLQWQQF